MPAAKCFPTFSAGKIYRYPALAAAIPEIMAPLSIDGTDAVSEVVTSGWAGTCFARAWRGLRSASVHNEQDVHRMSRTLSHYVYLAWDRALHAESLMSPECVIDPWLHGIAQYCTGTLRERLTAVLRRLSRLECPQDELLAQCTTRFGRLFDSDIKICMQADPRLGGIIEGAWVCMAGVLEQVAQGRVSLLDRDYERMEILPGYALVERSGQNESACGLDYVLYRKLGGGRWHLLATVGVIQRSEGFALVKCQGGQIGQHTISRQGRSVKLDRVVRRELNEHPKTWLAKQIVQKLLVHDPGRPLFWRKGDYQPWLYYHALPPGGGRTNLWAASVGLTIPQLRELTRRRRVELCLAGVASDLRETMGMYLGQSLAVREWRALVLQPHIAGGYDRMAAALDFVPEPSPSSWHVLRPD